MKDYYLRESQPAANFWDAYVCGNGRLGLTAVGSVPKETLLINDDTLWSGHEQFHENPRHYERLKKARELVFAGKVKEANNLINDEMEGRWFEAYMPLGELHITVGQKNNRRNMPLKRVIEPAPGEITGYGRELSLSEAVCRVNWQRDGVSYRQEYFVSHPADAAFVGITAEGEGTGLLNLAFALDSRLHAVNRTEGEAAYLSGIAPDHAEPSYTSVTPTLVYKEPEESEALRFACRAEVFETNGEVFSDGQRVYVNGADYVWIVLAAATNYAGYGRRRDPDAGRLNERLKAQCAALKESKKTARQLKEEHLSDYQALYGRVDLDLGEGLTGRTDTSRRMAYGAEGVDDPSLYALYLQYARYLIIAGSRPGTQPLNLQGIWNDTVSPPWSSNYTNNINVEMNYWSAEAGNLSECHLPLMDMIRELSDAGKKTAKSYYHSEGWVVHHNADLWRSTEPSCEDASWSWWPLGGAWLCQHIWTHYAYTKDEAFLGEMYPALRGACRFFLDFLVKNEEGYLVTAPSISPENKFFLGTEEELRALQEEIASGSRGPSNHPLVSCVTQASTMDMSLIRELFGNTIRAEEILGVEDPLTDRLKEAMAQFPPYKVGTYGQLLEWYEDYAECAPSMEHLSHLYPAYPADLFTWEKTPELMEAAKKSLERRNLHAGRQHGWPGAWRVSLMARFKEPLECGHILKDMGLDLGAGLFTKNCQQLDAIFGLGAGIEEMLLQSHAGYLEILPCIPVDWNTGSYRGLCARGGFEVDAAWRDGALTDVRIRSRKGGTCRVKAANLAGVDAVPAVWDEKKEVLSFETAADTVYTLCFKEKGPKEFFI